MHQGKGLTQSCPSVGGALLEGANNLVLGNLPSFLISCTRVSPAQKSDPVVPLGCVEHNA